MMRLAIAPCVLLACLLGTAAPASAQQSHCADCHFSRPDAPAAAHLSNWDRSAHSASRVGCEKCHGGDATTFDSLLAHRDILASSNPSSPVNWRNLPATCGSCHTGPYMAFQRSGHYALLQEGDRRVPVCSTCHGAAGYRRPSARALEAQCAQCHGPNGVAPRPNRAEAARNLYQGLQQAQDQLKTARGLIDRIKERPRRTALDDAYQQADAALTQAIQAGHQFVYDALQERLGVARQRIGALLDQLVN